MKKLTTMILALTIASATMFASCGKPTSSSGDNSANSGITPGTENSITVDPLTLEGLNENYLPVKDKISQMQGAIDIAIVFDDTLDGWQALADEYMRLHKNAVAVSLISNYSASTYTEKATQEISDENTEWDIVQGNVINAELWESRFYNMQAAVYGKNAYAGNKYWTDVLSEDAYITDKSGQSTHCYIMNSINLNTGWFVNEVALEKAYNAGYRNANNEKGYPKTWQDIINLCEYFVDLGYSSPLGISLDEDSVKSSQFTWLLRVYGDYYYRNEYNKLSTNENYSVDLTDPNPENNINFNLSYNKLLSTILDTNSSLGYVGPTSAKYKDFLTKLGQMKPYLNKAAATISFDGMRDAFLTQTKETDPQILLDFVGSGIVFGNLEKAEFKAGLFDYPTMVNDFVPEGTLTRDVGGNGGYLSVVKHSAEQNKLNLDFLKFVMSPYGQTIYYNALSKNENFAPQGLTTVKNELIQVPSRWAAFFNNKSVTFTGLSDSNRYIGWMIRGMDTDSTASDMAFEYWTKYLIATGSDALSLEQFSTNWYDVLKTSFPRVAALHDWHEKCYLFPDLPDGQVDHEALENM